MPSVDLDCIDDDLRFKTLFRVAKNLVQLAGQNLYELVRAETRPYWEAEITRFLAARKKSAVQLLYCDPQYTAGVEAWIAVAGPHYAKHLQIAHDVFQKWNTDPRFDGRLIARTIEFVPLTVILCDPDSDDGFAVVVPFVWEYKPLRRSFFLFKSSEYHDQFQAYRYAFRERFDYAGTRDTVLNSGQDNKQANGPSHQHPPLIRAEHLYMSDLYYAGQAGAMGPQAKASHMTFQQIWNDNQGQISLGSLVQELPVLRAALRKDASEPDHDRAVAAVADAEESAKANDGPEVLAHLRQAGKWAWEMASKLGLSVATEALKKALGL